MIAQVHASMEAKELRIENNKMIMSFMGVKPKKHRDSPQYYYSDLPFFSTNNTDEQKVIDSMAEYLKYDSDWNLLMPVVVECFDRYSDVHTNQDVFMADNQQFQLNDALLETNIESLYKAVLEFIDWYNVRIKNSL